VIKNGNAIWVGISFKALEKWNAKLRKAARKAGIEKTFASLCATWISLFGFKIPWLTRFVPPGTLLPKK
jgi:hypothetical protein